MYTGNRLYKEDQQLLISDATIPPEVEIQNDHIKEFILTSLS